MPQSATVGPRDKTQVTGALTSSAVSPSPSTEDFSSLLMSNAFTNGDLSFLEEIVLVY